MRKKGFGGGGKIWKKIVKGTVFRPKIFLQRWFLDDGKGRESKRKGGRKKTQPQTPGSARSFM